MRRNSDLNFPIFGSHAAADWRPTTFVSGRPSTFGCRKHPQEGSRMEFNPESFVDPDEPLGNELETWTRNGIGCHWHRGALLAVFCLAAVVVLNCVSMMSYYRNRVIIEVAGVYAEACVWKRRDFLRKWFDCWQQLLAAGSLWVVEFVSRKTFKTEVFDSIEWVWNWLRRSLHVSEGVLMNDFEEWKDITMK